MTPAHAPMRKRCIAQYCMNAVTPNTVTAKPKAIGPSSGTFKRRKACWLPVRPSSQFARASPAIVRPRVSESLRHESCIGAICEADEDYSSTSALSSPIIEPFKSNFQSLIPWRRGSARNVRDSTYGIPNVQLFEGSWGSSRTYHFGAWTEGVSERH